jgi:hypothetical protein
MAEQSSPPPSNIGGNGFIWIALVAASTFFLTRELPLEGSRPPATQQFITEPADTQDIDARLWQDPFAAVNDTLMKSPELKPSACNLTPLKEKPPEEIQNHCRPPMPKPHTRVLVVSVSAEPYSDNDEFRRRARYGVLAGLSAEGFVPANAEHIGFYWPNAPQQIGSTDIIAPQYIPFEQFDSDKNPERHVLLLWFDEAVLRRSPIEQLSSLLCRPFANPEHKISILGPQSSTPLQDMVREARKGKQSSCLEFYVYSATTDDATLIPEERKSCTSRDTFLQEFFRKQGIDLYRMIATDEDLAYAMTQELKLRRIDGDKKNHSHIALVSERDTVYGRALPQSMARCLGEKERCPAGALQLTDKTWLHPFKYLRGLDGQTPGAPSGDPTNRSSDKRTKQDTDTKSDAKGRPETKTRDRAEGQSQFDYVRRLGEEMQQLDAELRRNNPRGIEAIGVLGSDLYDKLLVLQALRPLFTDALFFTTDLDALILHPVAQMPTRNLLVASGFGLQLRSEIQGEIPPFRSSYETASFLATRIAVRSENRPPPAWSTQPLVFEIGASRPFQFADKDTGAPAASDDKRHDHKPCHDDLLKCADVQPLASEMYPYLSMPTAILLAIIGLSITLISGRVRRQAWKVIDRFMRGSTNAWHVAARIIAAVVALCGVTFALAVAMYVLWRVLATGLTANGEPITLLEGISIWPTIFFRLAALALCVWLILRAWKLLKENMDNIVDELKLNEMWRTAKKKQKEAFPSGQPWGGFASFFWWPGERATKGGAPVTQAASEFWRKYIHQGRRTGRFLRISAGVVLMFAVAWLISSVFGDQLPPTRGTLSFRAYEWVAIFLFVANLFLIFFVADATLLCWSAIRSFRTEKGVWPPVTVRDFNRRLALPESVLDSWIALQFISKRTACITGLIYYPFLILGLLVLSRNRVFANFPPSRAMLVVTGISVLILMGCALALHWSAEASRTEARVQLNDEIVKAMSLKDAGRLASQLQMMLRRVDELRDGAFSPFSQQPLVRAILLPLGGLGGSTLFEYLFSTGLVG